MFKRVLLIISLCTTTVLADDSRLSPDMIGKLQQSFSRDTHTTALQNALSSTGIKAIAENRQVLAAHNTTFSHKVKAKGISNQKSSGRCWMFAGFNTLRPVIMTNLELDEFEFSHIYLQFWDKLEKANTFALDMSIDKRQRLLFRDSTVNHAMAFIGVDLVDGQPVKWLVENSWGTERGKKGLWTMYDNWFEAYVYTLITHKKYVPDEVLKILEKPAQKQPVWDPMW